MSVRDSGALLLSSLNMRNKIFITTLHLHQPSAGGRKLVIHVPFYECVSLGVQHSSALAVVSLSENSNIIQKYCHSSIGQL